jgi:hypothetical protein
MEEPQPQPEPVLDARVLTPPEALAYQFAVIGIVRDDGGSVVYIEFVQVDPVPAAPPNAVTVARIALNRAGARGLRDNLSALDL